MLFGAVLLDECKIAQARRGQDVLVVSESCYRDAVVKRPSPWVLHASTTHSLSDLVRCVPSGGIEEVREVFKVDA